MLPDGGFSIYLQMVHGNQQNQMDQVHQWNPVHGKDTIVYLEIRT